MKWLLGIATVVLLFAHQDTWQWKDGRLLLGFLPVGLAYHGAYTVVSALLLALLVRHAWPAQLEGSERELTSTEAESAGK